jgi:hypothetical protein
MFNVRISTAQFTAKLAEYVKTTGKGLAVAVKEQAGLLAQALTKNTYPKSASEGKRRVEIDVKRVFLSSHWWENVFKFRQVKLGERVKQLVRARDEGDVGAVFGKSPKLSKIRIERFDPRQHEKLRRKGRVLVPDPRSYPLKEQTKIRQYIRSKGKQVGIAKAGWAGGAARLGKPQPAWLNRSGKGDAVDKTANANNPTVILANRVGYFRDLDAKANIISRSLAGRAKAMIASAKRQLAEAAKRAGF